ncbi:hypothetical protein [Zunongwangia endophytica]|uniref:Uncharacterized protein n=1 Tax=Zunongwangia endophytica TaxID=1808945 RepID=A0ABV8H545_9FLAO|nr:hypothetical protein [Zunongwangia endophytica]MDN3595319.1 hypothetical protein [Zunongwangia endophytica]
MAEETIYLNQVLEIMRKPDSDGKAVKFDIAVRTFNRNSKSGGTLNSYENAKQVMKEAGMDKNSIYALQHFKKSKIPKIRKNPQHFSNKTRNIRLENGEVKKIHIRYIISFNGKKVIY